MEVVATLVFVLISATFLPCFLVVLTLKLCLRVVELARGRRHGSGLARPTRSAFLGYRIPRSRDSPGPFFHAEEPLLPPECCARLAVALYRRHKAAAEAADCVFCLSEIGDGEEVRELRCRHVFHRAYLDAWLLRPGARCPLCREHLLPADPPHAVSANGFNGHGLPLTSAAAAT